jgi:hypothetical protein
VCCLNQQQLVIFPLYVVISALQYGSGSRAPAPRQRKRLIDFLMYGSIRLEISEASSS